MNKGVFGWLKRFKSDGERSASLRPDVAPATEDQNGRPRPPEFPNTSTVEKVSDAQKMIAVRWAAEWCGYRGDVSEKWLHGLNNFMIGKRESGVPKDEFIEEKRVLAMAVRAVQIACERNRAIRTSDTFPWHQLRIGPVDHDDPNERPCKAALAIEGKHIPTEEFQAIPLPGCDAKMCRCRYRPVTQAEAAKQNSHK